ncbi:hypothetical protein QJS66_15110 [Kocuria rhizophila]|nr:hypothetical protein QJS66_15110 [Kocuria rhizophila]
MIENRQAINAHARAGVRAARGRARHPGPQAGTVNALQEGLPRASAWRRSSTTRTHPCTRPSGAYALNAKPWFVSYQ